MAALKITEAVKLRRGLNRTGDDAFQRRADLLGKGFHHAVPRLAQRYNQCTRIRVQVVEIVADAQDSPLTMHMPREGLADRRFGQRTMENREGGRPHLPNLRFLGPIEHAEDYRGIIKRIISRARLRCAPQSQPKAGGGEITVSFTHASIASRNSRKRPSKKWSAPSIKTNFLGSDMDAASASNFARGPNWSRAPLIKSFGSKQDSKNSKV